MTSRAYPVAYAPSRLSAHWNNDTVTWEEICSWVANPKVSRNKETGNYILARLATTTTVHKKGATPCTGVHRENNSIVERAPLLAMDVDHPEEGFEVSLELALRGVQHLWHTTHSSTPAEPRYRILVAVDRPMSPVEYCEAAEALAHRMSRASFDDGTFQPARFMFKPGTPSLDTYEYHIGEGVELSVDTLLDEYTALAAEGADNLTPARPHKNKRNPFELPDPAGAFNRAYEDLDDLIEAYDLPYEKESDSRYRLKGASSEAGFGPIKDTEGLFYSNHAGDPAYGVACSAFDLVRLHRFKEIDEGAKSGTPVNRLPSHTAMCELAAQDRRVTQEIFNTHPDLQDPEESEKEPDEPDWTADLRISPRTGRMLNDVQNWLLVRENDPLLRRIRTNDLTKAPEWTVGPLPWGRVATPEDRELEDQEIVELRFHLQKTYRIQEVARQDVLDLVSTVASRNRYNPVRDYLTSVRWDGIPRLEFCLPGVEPTDYTRMVARKCLVAAVARAFEPGIKWDHSLVLYGGEGIGKSMWVSAMARGFDGKLPAKLDTTDSIRVVHRNWIVVGDEAHSLRRADFEFVKEFLTRQKDQWRNPFEKMFQQYPRMSVIWFTTNDGTFLRNEPGNRRFLVVNCSAMADWDKLHPAYVDQVWAEAMDVYMSGTEQLWLTPEEDARAAEVRGQYTEEDLVRGYVGEYLSRLVPANWDDMTRQQRTEWMFNRDNGFEEPPGVRSIDRVCAAEILELARGRHASYVDRAEVNRVTNSLKSMDGWILEGLTEDSGGFGPQLMFVRKDSII